MSELRAATISNLAGTGAATLTGQTAAKAWVNYNNSGVLSVYASQNISSVTDEAAGRATVNMANALTDSNYALSGSCNNSSGNEGHLLELTSVARTASLVRVSMFKAGVGEFDATRNSVVLTR